MALQGHSSTLYEVYTENSVSYGMLQSGPKCLCTVAPPPHPIRTRMVIISTTRDPALRTPNFWTLRAPSN